MHNSSLVAIAQYFWRIRTSVLYGNQKNFNTEAVNDYPPIRFEIRFERKFPIVGLYFLTLPVETLRGKAIWNANGGFVSVLLTHLFVLLSLLLGPPKACVIVVVVTVSWSSVISFCLEVSQSVDLISGESSLRHGSEVNEVNVYLHSACRRQAPLMRYRFPYVSADHCKSYPTDMSVYSQLLSGTHSSLTTEAGSGWVGLGAWFCAEVVYPSKDGHQRRHHEPSV